MVLSDTTPIGNTNSDDHFFEQNDFDTEEDEENEENSASEFNNTNSTKWPLRDHLNFHPVASFNTIEWMVHFSEDGSYFNEMGYALDDNLMVVQVFSSKDHLKWVMHDFRIRSNHTFKNKKSNKQMYTVLYTNQNY
jgi:hypothetical protein